MTARSRFIVRVAGLPMDALHGLRASRTPDVLRRTSECRDAIAALRDGLSERLYAAVGAMAERRERNKVLEVRRRLFNGRPLAPDTRAALHAMLAPALVDAIAAYDDLLRTRERLATELETAYADDLADARTAVRALVRDEDFQAALLLSSASLFGNLERFLKGDSRAGRSREEQLERGLLRYLVRMGAKSTPYARFCTVLPGRFDSDSRVAVANAALLGFDADPARKRGHLRLNKSLHAVLWAHLSARPAIRSTLVVELNSTLAEDGERWRFLASTGARELFQRLGRSPALDLIVRTVRGGNAITFGALVARIVADPEIDATPVDAEAYLDRLVEFGLLGLRRVVRDQEPDWDVPLAAYLERIDDEHGALVAGMLRDVRARLTEYAGARPVAREPLGRSIDQTILATLERLGLEPEIPRGIALFEDASADAEMRIARTPGVERALASLAQFLEIVRPVAFPRVDQATMRYYFDRRYPDREAVPLLQFYEDFSRDHLKAHMAQEARVRSGTVPGAVIDHNPLRAPAVTDILVGISRIQELLRACWHSNPCATSIDITPGELRFAVGDLRVPDRDCHSFGMFAQIVAPHADDAQVIVSGGQALTGYGKFFSRFLYVLPPDVRDAVVAENAGLTRDWLAEICGDHDFNPNLHPPLLPHEIAYPGTEGDADSPRLRCADLVVRRDDGDANNLHLVHAPSGQRVLAIDLGFMNPRLRPALYQLLARFAPVMNFVIPVPSAPDRPAQHTSAGESAAADTARPRGVTYRPRITFDSRVVLARRRWTVDVRDIPARDVTESEAAYFGRINEWREANGIPECSYVRLQGNRSGASRATTNTDAREPNVSAAPDEGDAIDAEFDEGAEAADPSPAATAPERAGEGAPAAVHAKRKVRPIGKPQYIDFRSPVLVMLFLRTAATVPSFRAAFEECYPAESDLPSFDGRSFACELCLEFTAPAAHVAHDGERERAAELQGAADD
ncbi:MAG TPA: lantibiotic dehydratase [Gemmatimonadaceae bacterium]|nr:lantibiotic dehydratase [Gemmatimonadaceae bacterium]